MVTAKDNNLLLEWIYDYKCRDNSCVVHINITINQTLCLDFINSYYNFQTIYYLEKCDGLKKFRMKILVWYEILTR